MCFPPAFSIFCLSLFVLSSQFLRLLSEDSSETSSGSMELELALSRSVDAMALSLEVTPISSEATRKKQEEYEHDCCERISRIKAPTISEVADAQSEGVLLPDSKMSANKEEALDEPGCSCDEKSMVQISYQRKVAVLFELISACLADMPEDDKEQSRPRKGYDARHRVALRLLATWLDVKWIKMVRLLKPAIVSNARLHIYSSCGHLLFCINVEILGHVQFRVHSVW